MEFYTDWLLSNRGTASLVDRKVVSDVTDDVVKFSTPLADFNRTYTSWLKQEVFDATFWDWVSTNRSALGFTSAQVTSLRTGFTVNIDDATNPTLSLRNFSNQSALRKLNDAVDSAFGDTSTFRALVPQPIDDDAPWITGGRTALEPRSYVNGFNFDSLPFTNDAPVLNAASTPTGVTVLEDSGIPAGPVGTLVSSLVDFATPVGPLDNVTDADAGALLGIAVTAAATINGAWFYSTNNGASWSALGVVSDGTARLLAADGNTRIYFQGAANFDGQADLTFRAWDRTSGSNGGMTSTVVNGGRTAFSTATDTATFDVSPVNDAPVLTGDLAATVIEGGSVVIGAPDLGYTDIDDVDAGVVFTVTDQVNGHIRVNNIVATSFSGTDLASGLVSFRHDDSETVSASFKVNVEDGNEDGSTPLASVFTLAVTSVNDAPVAVDDAATTAEGTPATINVLANDSDDGPILSVQAAAALHGTVSINADFTLQYTPNASYSGSDTITYTVSDGSLTDTAMVAVTVTPVNDAPVFTSGIRASIQEKQAIATAAYDANATDVDGDLLTYFLPPGVGENDLFNINTITGAVTFKASPKFDPVDANQNFYNISVVVSDGYVETSQAVEITVKSQILAVAFTDVNDNSIYEAGTDKLIASLLDTNKDFKVSVGDTIQWGTYPKDFTIDGPRGVFIAGEVVIDRVVASTNSVGVFVNGQIVIWRTTAGEIFNDDINHFSDVANLDLIDIQSIFTPGMPGSTGPVGLVGVGNEGFLDIQFFL